MVSIVFLLLAGMFNGVMDKLSYRFSQSIFRDFKNWGWWDPKFSWKNK